MAKRKTRQQKIASDQRRPISGENTFVFSLANSSKIPQKTIIKTTTMYPYLIKDLTKTAILTAIIVTFQLSLFFLLKSHIIRIPGLGY